MLNSETVKPEVAASIPGTEMSIFAPDGIARLEQIDNYRSVSPFPHLVIDNIFNNDMLRMILQEWPSSGNDSELHDDGTYVKKNLEQPGKPSSVLSLRSFLRRWRAHLS